MKRTCILIVLAIYTLATGGVSVRFHYCGDDLSSVSFAGSPADCGCEEDEDDGCCKDEHHYFKIQEVHQQAVSLIPDKGPQWVIEIRSPEVILPLARPAVAGMFPLSRPPGAPPCRLHQLHCRISC